LFWHAKDIHFFYFIAHFLLLKNTYKTPYSLKAVKYGRLIAGGASNTKQPLLILTLNKKARAFERSCIVSQYNSLGSIFEGDMPL
jgi:hypothetical protein